MIHFAVSSRELPEKVSYQNVCRELGNRLSIHAVWVAYLCLSV